MASAHGARRAGAAVVLAMAVAFAGCGPSAEQQFRKNDLRPLRQKIEQDKTDLSGLLRTVRLGRKKDAQAVQQQIDVIAGTADRIAALKPPGSVRTEFVRYARANEQLVGALRRFARALVSGRPRALDRAGGQTRDAAGAVRRSDDALQAALTAKR